VRHLIKANDNHDGDGESEGVDEEGASIDTPVIIKEPFFV